MTECLFPANSFPELVNMMAPQNRKLTQHESDQNIQQFYNNLCNSDISDADFEYLTNVEYSMYSCFFRNTGETYVMFGTSKYNKY